MARTGYLDLADIGPCNFCGDERLRVRDAAGEPIDLYPMALRGEDVASGYWLRDDLSRPLWAIHLRSVAPPGRTAFLPHPCRGASPRKGTPQVTTPDPFGSAAPPGATGPDTEDLNGKLILLHVHAIERGIQTKFGPGDAVRCDVVDLTNGEQHINNLLFGKVLVNQFAVGTKYVGRITQGTAQGGNSAPWIWADGDANDKATAVKYLTWAAGQSVSTPAAPPAAAPAPAQPAPPPAGDPWASAPTPPPVAPAPAAPAAPVAAAPPWA